MHSSPVPPSLYDLQDLCHPTLTLRVNNYPELEEVGAMRAQKDWKKFVDPVPKENYRGGLGPQWNFVALAIPECLPERLEIVAYANEFAFLYDDITDCVSKEQGDLLNNQTMAAFFEGSETGSILASKKLGTKFIQAQILREMMAIDQPRALVTMKFWAAFVELAAGREHFTDFGSLEEYIPYRILDVGKMFWFGIVTFGMGLTIPNHELELCSELSRDAYIVFGLQNDLFSWEKERDAAIENGQNNVVNALFVLMGGHDMTIEEAKILCVEKIRYYEAEYIKTLRWVEGNEYLSEDLRRYVEALQFASTANAIWSMTCPRYQREVKLNARQQETMGKY